jgi:NOL1/NOP2/sun family putative RNA methylase
MKKTFIPEDFKKKYEKILGIESEEFFSFCKTKYPKSIWVNSLKIKPGLLEKILVKKGWKLERLFHENAFGLENIEKPGQTREFKDGLFNLQEKASMLPAIALNPEQKNIVLDACAAPGNKTLQLSCLMNGLGKIVAVEKNFERYKSLCFNIKKFGMGNVEAKRMDLLGAKKKNLFDKILLDAPCSSEGLVRKDFDALKNWSNELVQIKSSLQKKLVKKCIELLKPNGTIVYSTCSLSPEEDEEIVDFALKNGGFFVEEIAVDGFKTRKGISQWNGKKYDSEVSKCARIYPQDNNSQAFFLAKLVKK